METNETFEPTGAEPGLILNHEAQGYLRESGKWAYFLGILGFIGSGLILLAAFFVNALFSLSASYQQMPFPAGMRAVMSLAYILIAIFYFFFSYYLFQFGNRIKKGILFSNQTDVSKAMGKLKSFFKLWGITTIVIIALYVLMIIVFLVVGIGAASMMHR